MDLDNEELEATRKLNGLDKKNNIEEDIKTMLIDADDILNMQELQAIKKKCQELGWIE